MRNSLKNRRKKGVDRKKRQVISLRKKEEDQGLEQKQIRIQILILFLTQVQVQIQRAGQKEIDQKREKSIH